MIEKLGLSSCSMGNGVRDLVKGKWPKLKKLDICKIMLIYVAIGFYLMVIQQYQRGNGKILQCYIYLIPTNQKVVNLMSQFHC
jgi:hypothetical protein